MRVVRAIFSVVLVALISVACGGSTSIPTFASSVPASAPIATSDVQAQLDSLPVKGRAPKTGYARSQFGSGWEDPDGNGCDARRDVLKRDSVGTPETRGKAACVFTTTIHDPYSDQDISSKEADIDHVVALSDAWQKGAQALSPAEREALANDPDNLLAVSASLNRQKSDGDAATWLPPNRSFWCKYVSLQVNVKVKYRLWVTQAEKTRMEQILQNC